MGKRYQEQIQMSLGGYAGTPLTLLQINAINYRLNKCGLQLVQHTDESGTGLPSCEFDIRTYEYPQDLE